MPPSSAPALAPATIPIHEPPAGSFRVPMVIPEPGSYMLVIDGMARRPDGLPSCLDPVTGNWLVVSLVNTTTGEVVRPVSPPTIGYLRSTAP